MEMNAFNANTVTKTIMIDLNDNLSMKLSIDSKIDLIRPMNVLFLA